MSHLQYSFYNIWSSSDYMFYVSFADLVVKFFENLFYMAKQVLFRVFQLDSLVAAEVEVI